MGRPKALIDWETVGALFEADCTVTGVCASIGIDPDTLARRCRQDLKTDLAAFRQQKKASGDDLLRKTQFATAIQGNVTMQIWLGKQRLGQSDKSETTTTIRKVEVQWTDPVINDSNEITDSVH